MNYIVGPVDYDEQLLRGALFTVLGYQFAKDIHKIFKGKIPKSSDALRDYLLVCYIGYCLFKYYKSTNKHSNCPRMLEIEPMPEGGPVTTKKNYTPLSPEVIEYIKEQNVKVIEMCAGDGQNAENLRSKGVEVDAFDIKSSEGVVNYGLAGTVEDSSDYGILLLCSSFEGKKSIDKFNGNKVIVGGYCHLNTYKKKRETLRYMSEPGEVDIEDGNYTLELRPSYEWMLDNGWEFERAFFSPYGGNYHCGEATSYAFYVFNRKLDV